MRAAVKQIHEWATAWNVPHACMADLLQRMGMGYSAPQVVAVPGASESAVQSRVRIEAAFKGVTLWRNNVGALMDERGVPVRYGLCNDTAALNKQIKSGDLIGIRPVLITAALVGHVIGQFVSRECKRDGWTYDGTPHEVAQAKWNSIITASGGDAAFTSGVGSI